MIASFIYSNAAGSGLREKFLVQRFYRALRSAAATTKLIFSSERPAKSSAY